VDGLDARAVHLATLRAVDRHQGQDGELLRAEVLEEGQPARWKPKLMMRMTSTAGRALKRSQYAVATSGSGTRPVREHPHDGDEQRPQSTMPSAQRNTWMLIQNP
jgi:hypothetical protein